MFKNLSCRSLNLKYKLINFLMEIIRHFLFSFLQMNSPSNPFNCIKWNAHFVKHVCVKLWFVWECSKIVRYVEHGVSFLNEYVNFCPYDHRQSEVENIFMDDYLFCKSPLFFFFHSALVLPFFHLDMEFFRCKNGKTIRLNIEQVSF